MLDIVAFLAVFLFWTSLFLVPLAGWRAFGLEGRMRLFALASVFTFFMVLFGFTRAMSGGTAMEPFAWSLGWLMPLGLAVYVRVNAPVARPGLDVWLGAAAVASFLPAAGFLPGALRWLANALW